MEAFVLFLFSLLLTSYVIIDIVTGSGVLVNPPSRGVMWKEGFPTETNFNYMQLNCGGVKQNEIGRRQCGVCGDAEAGPRLHEFGNKYGTGTISRYYDAGVKEMKVSVELLAFEKGFFEFRICPANDKPVTQECLNQNLLPIKEGYVLGMPMRYYPNQAGVFDLTLAVPPNMTCDRCVLQWRYRTGVDPISMKQGLPEGPQEEFYNCADVRIGGAVPDSILSTGNFTTETASASNVVLDSKPWTSDINFPTNVGPELGGGITVLATGAGDGLNALDVTGQSQSVVNVQNIQSSSVTGSAIGADIHELSGGNIDVASSQIGKYVNVNGVQETVVGVHDHSTGKDTKAATADSQGTGSTDSVLYEQLGIGVQDNFATAGVNDKSVKGIIDTISSVDPMTFVDRMAATSGTGFEIAGTDMMENSRSSIDPQFMRPEKSSGVGGMVSAGEMQGAKIFIGMENFTPVGKQTQSIVHKEGGVVKASNDPMFVEHASLKSTTGMQSGQAQIDTTSSVISEPSILSETVFTSSTHGNVGSADIHHSDPSHSGQTIIDSGFIDSSSDPSLLNRNSKTVVVTNVGGQDQGVSDFATSEPVYLADNLLPGTGPTEGPGSIIVDKKSAKTASLVISPAISNTISLTLVNEQAGLTQNAVHNTLTHGQTDFPDKSTITNAEVENRKTASLVIDGSHSGTIRLSSHDNMVNDQIGTLPVDRTLTSQPDFAQADPIGIVGKDSASQNVASLTIENPQSGTISFASQGNIVHDPAGWLHVEQSFKESHIPLSPEGSIITSHSEKINLMSQDKILQAQTGPMHIDNTAIEHTGSAHPSLLSSFDEGQHSPSLMSEEPQVSLTDDLMHSRTGNFLHIDHTVTGTPAVKTKKTASLLIDTDHPRTVQTVTHNSMIHQQGDQLPVMSSFNEKSTLSAENSGQQTRTIYMTSHGDIMAGPNFTPIHDKHAVAIDPAVSEKQTASIVTDGPTPNTIETILHDGILQTGRTHADQTLIDTSNRIDGKTASLLIESPQTEAIHIISHTDTIYDPVSPMNSKKELIVAPETKTASLVIETQLPGSMHLSTHDSIMHGQTDQPIPDHVMTGPGNINIESPLKIQRQFPFNGLDVSTIQASETQNPVSTSKDTILLQTGKHLHSSSIPEISVTPGVESKAKATEQSNLISTELPGDASSVHIVKDSLLDPYLLTTNQNVQISEVIPGHETLHSGRDGVISSVDQNTFKAIQSDTTAFDPSLASHTITVDTGNLQQDVNNIYIENAINTITDEKALKDAHTAVRHALDKSMGAIDITNAASTTADVAVGLTDVTGPGVTTGKSTTAEIHGSTIGSDKQNIQGIDSSGFTESNIPLDVGLDLAKAEQIYAEPLSDIGGTQSLNKFTVDKINIMERSVIFDESTGPTLVGQNEVSSLAMNTVSGISKQPEIVVNNLIAEGSVPQTDPAYTEFTVMPDTGLTVVEPMHVGVKDMHLNLEKHTSIQDVPAPSVVPVEIKIQDIEASANINVAGDPNISIQDPFGHIPAQSLPVIPLEPTSPEIIPEASTLMVLESEASKTDTALGTNTISEKDIIPLAIPDASVFSGGSLKVSTDVAADKTLVKENKSASLSDILLDLRNVRNRLRNKIETPQVKSAQVSAATSAKRTDTSSTVESKKSLDSLAQSSVMAQSGSESNRRISDSTSERGTQFRFLRDPRTGMMTRIQTGVSAVFNQQSELPLPDGRVMSVSANRASVGPAQTRSMSFSSSVNPVTTGEQMPPYMIESSSGIQSSPRMVSNIVPRSSMAFTGSRDRRGQVSDRQDVTSQRRDSRGQRQMFPVERSLSGGMDMRTSFIGQDMQSRGASMATVPQGGAGTSFSRGTGMSSSMTRTRMPTQSLGAPVGAGATTIRTGLMSMPSPRMTPLRTFPRRTGSFSGISGSSMGTGGMVTAGTGSVMSGPPIGAAGMGGALRPGMAVGTTFGTAGFPRPVVGGVGPTFSMVRPTGSALPTLTSPFSTPGFGMTRIPGSMPGTGIFPTTSVGGPFGMMGMRAPSGPFMFGSGSPLMSRLGTPIGGPTGLGIGTMFRPGFDTGITRFGGGGVMPFGSGFPMMTMGGPVPIFR